VNRRKKSTAKEAGDAGHVEGIERPVVEALDKYKESEDSSDAEAGSEKPARLGGRVD